MLDFIAFHFFLFSLLLTFKFSIGLDIYDIRFSSLWFAQFSILLIFKIPPMLPLTVPSRSVRTVLSAFLASFNCTRDITRRPLVRYSGDKPRYSGDKPRSLEVPRQESRAKSTLILFVGSFAWFFWFLLTDFWFLPRTVFRDISWQPSQGINLHALTVATHKSSRHTFALRVRS